MAIPLGWNPNNTKRRQILGVLKFDDDVLCASFNKLIKAVQDALELVGNEIATGRSVLDAWMLRENGQPLTAASFNKKFQHMIISKHGLEDREVKIGVLQYKSPTDNMVFQVWTE